MLTEKTRKRLLDGWLGVFRHVILELIQRFADMDEYARKNTYKAVERIFYEQCEVHKETVSIKQKTGGNVMQNPPDLDATYDGHKGPGYQAQISETCYPENEAQLITSVPTATDRAAC